MAADLEVAALQRSLEELRVRVARLERRLDNLEPETQRGPVPPAAGESPVLDAVADALDALGFNGKG